MANVIQLKRGAESARTGFTPAAGEPIYVTDENKLYIGDGSTAAQSLSALGGDLTMANGSNNRVMTATSSSGMNAEANLTFDGSTLAVTGDATVSDDLGLVSDSAKLTFGANSEVELVHVHNEGLILKHTATADDKPVSLVLQTGETDIQANDVIGKIGFQAPDEGTGTDAILMAAEIAAISEGDFAADDNATKMVFRTGSSAAAADRMTLSSGGNLNVTGTITGTGTSVFADLDISGDVDVDGTLEADAITLGGTALAASATTNTVNASNIASGTLAAARMAAAQTAITSLLATDIKIGEDDQTKIDFETADTINFYAGNEKQLILTDGALTPGADNILDLGSSSVEFKDAYFDGTVTTDALTVSGNTTIGGTLAVTGDTTVVDILAGAVSNTIQFEGSTADGNETVLGVIDPDGDRTINLPNVSGTLPVLAAASTTQISSTPEELNILDGATVVVGEINALDLGSTAVGNAIASKAVVLDSNKDYTGMRNFTITGDATVGGDIDLEGDMDINGTLETDALTIAGVTLAETISDTTGAMFSSNTETGLSATYQDADNTIDLAIAAAQTTITSILATDIKIGEDDQTKIDFEDANTINFYLNNAKDFVMTANTFTAESGSSIVVPAGGLTIGSTAVDATAAELNIMDGGTSATSTTLASADRMVINDAGTMKQVALSDPVTYLEDGGTSGFNVDGGTYS